MRDPWKPIVRQMIADTRRNLGISDAAASRMEADAFRWIALARSNGVPDDDIQLTVVGDGAGSVKLLVGPLDRVSSPPGSEAVH